MIESSPSVAVIGAGPAGLFAARALAERGFHVAIFNRDIKPGGLAEYGIYPTKRKMKDGLRNQFRQILARPEIDYFGNVVLGEGGDLTLEKLRALGFAAILVSVGAQGAKHLGIPGEDLRGVYHAKDIVYHYNRLPPFSEREYAIGKRVAIIGVGNVMVDVAHWLIVERSVEEVTAVARRGPADVKFDKKELEEVISCLDMERLENEVGRVRPALDAVEQDPAVLINLVAEVAQKIAGQNCRTNLGLRFLSSPVAIRGDETGGVSGLLVEENLLTRTTDGGTRAVGTGQTEVLPVDTVIFAIGDIVDSSLGLPIVGGEFAKNPEPVYPVDGGSYEAYDPHQNQPIEDVFLAGWARKPSVGLVGIARKDGTNAAAAVAQYLAGQPQCPSARENTRRCMEQLGHPVITKDLLTRLETAESSWPEYRLTSNQEMLRLINLA